MTWMPVTTLSAAAVSEQDCSSVSLISFGVHIVSAFVGCAGFQWHECLNEHGFVPDVPPRILMEAWNMLGLQEHDPNLSANVALLTDRLPIIMRFDCLRKAFQDDWHPGDLPKLEISGSN